MKTPIEQLIAGRYADAVASIRALAHKTHADVNQHYDGDHPYSIHLDMVADAVVAYADEVLADDAEFLPMIFGTYFHDAMEDARMTYNDVRRVARTFMATDEQAQLAADLVYALTNEKGRTRAERANERYYACIRETPYAPMVKLADRIANMTYSATHQGGKNIAMLDVYRRELPHFIESITVTEAPDGRYVLPPTMVEQVLSI